MQQQGFLARHGIVRQAVGADLFGFGLPALIVFSLGVVVSAPDGIWATIGGPILDPGSVSELGLPKAIGIAFFVGGLTLAVVAVCTLRKFYASTLVIREDHQLITHGVYRIARHPIYTGVLLACIGISGYGSSLYGLLIMLALIPIFLNRIRMEERLLTEEFGEDYRSYQRTTRKLIPFMY